MKGTGEMMAFVDVVFDGPPGPECGRFVEVENEAGASVSAGGWIDRGDGYWALRIQTQATQPPDAELAALVARVRAPIRQLGDSLIGDVCNLHDVLDLCARVERLAREHTTFNAYERMCRLADKRLADLATEREAHAVTTELLRQSRGLHDADGREADEWKVRADRADAAEAKLASVLERVRALGVERWRRLKDTCGVSARARADLHPDRCACQKDDQVIHSHYPDAPHRCARCGKCDVYCPAVSEVVADVVRAVVPEAFEGKP